MARLKLLPRRRTEELKKYRKSSRGSWHAPGSGGSGHLVFGPVHGSGHVLGSGLGLYTTPGPTPGSGHTPGTAARKRAHRFHLGFPIVM